MGGLWPPLPLSNSIALEEFNPPSLPSISIDRSLSIFTQLAFFAFFDLNHRFDHWLNSAIIQTLQSSNCLSLQCALVYPESRTWKFRAAQWHELIIFTGLIWLVRSCLAASYNHCTERSGCFGPKNGHRNNLVFQIRRRPQLVTSLK